MSNESKDTYQLVRDGNPLSISGLVRQGDDVVHHAIDVAHHDVLVMEGELSRFQEWLVHRHEKILIFCIVASLAIFMSIAAFMWMSDSFNIESVGYGGIWGLHFIGAASMAIPVPSLLALTWAAVPDLGGLNPMLLGICAGSAEAIGEITGYAIGLGGRGRLQKNRFYPKARRVMDRYGGKALFLIGVIPNPIFDIMGFVAGSLGYPVNRFLLILLLAKSIKSTAVAYFCYFLGSAIYQWILDTSFI